MKHDTQHLDFLVSQYLDDTLDANNRKLVEQELSHNPTARLSLKEQREVQDLLDDWGNRIPLIDWKAFDQKLDERLSQQQLVSVPVARYRSWFRPLSAAAAIILAIGVGYTWHALSQPTSSLGPNQAAVNTNSSQTVVHFDEDPVATPNVRVVKFDDVPNHSATSTTSVAVDSHATNPVPTNNKVPSETALNLLHNKNIPGSVRVNSEVPITTQPAIETLH